MVLVVRRKDTKSLALITKLITSDKKPTYIWCDDWPGRHTLGEDCFFVFISQKQMPIVEYFIRNPCDTIRQAANELKRTYIEVFRVVKELNIPFKAERKERNFQQISKPCSAVFVF